MSSKGHVQGNTPPPGRPNAFDIWLVFNGTCLHLYIFGENQSRTSHPVVLNTFEGVAAESPRGEHGNFNERTGGRRGARRSGQYERAHERNKPHAQSRELRHHSHEGPRCHQTVHRTDTPQPGREGPPAALRGIWQDLRAHRAERPLHWHAQRYVSHSVPVTRMSWFDLPPFPS